MRSEDCPVCSRSLGTWINLPRGAIVVCGKCLSVLVFGADGSFRQATEQLLAALPAEARLAMERAQLEHVTTLLEGQLPS